jgi:hypothetical protein
LGRVQGTDIDKTWNGFDVFAAGMAEVNLGIMCACAPSIQHFVKGFSRGVSTKMSSINGGSALPRAAKNMFSGRLRGGSRFTDSKISSLGADTYVEHASERESELLDSQKYPSAKADYTTPVLSHASSQSPLTGRSANAHRGASSNRVLPGFNGRQYDDNDHEMDDWTNSSKLEV